MTDKNPIPETPQEKIMRVAKQMQQILNDEGMSMTPTIELQIVKKKSALDIITPPTTILSSPELPPEENLMNQADFMK